MSLYLLINVLSVAIPLIFSFHKRLNFVAQWKYVFPAIFIALVPFIIWDVLFTRSGIWGFNGDYLLGIDLIHLPLEEWLFFICIPYACLFTHHSLQKMKSGFKLSERSTDFITVLSLAVFLLLMVFFHDKAYTFVNAAFAFVILMIARLTDRSVLSSYFLTFLIILIPFFVVNGILTGFGIPEQIVWYNDAENMGIRMGTIPVEDAIYAFSLILLNLIISKKLSRSFQ